MQKFQKYILKKFNPKSVNYDHIELYFNEFEFIQIYKKEVIDIEIKFADQLISYGINRLSPLIYNGYIKLKILDNIKDNDVSSCEDINFIENRKDYLEKELPTTQRKIFFISFVDKYGIERYLLGETKLTYKDGYVYLTYSNSESLPTDSKYFYTNLPYISKENIANLILDFSNIDQIEIEPSEIVDIKLKRSPQLVWAIPYIERTFLNGYIKIKLENSIKPRNIYMPDRISDPKQITTDYQKVYERLFKNLDYTWCDITNLLMMFNNANLDNEEVIQVPSCDFSKANLKGANKKYLPNRNSFCFVEKLDDEIIQISFGKLAVERFNILTKTTN